MMQRPSVAGVVLIVLGALFLVAQWMGVGGEGVVALIGIAFLTAYFLTRHYGFLVPGGIMTGLGIGIIYAQRLQVQGAPVFLGLGLGFIAVFLLGRLRGRWAADWWPLIPGGILAAIGLLLAADQAGLLRMVGRWWPLVPIALGIGLLTRRRALPHGRRHPHRPRRGVPPGGRAGRGCLSGADPDRRRRCAGVARSGAPMTGREGEGKSHVRRQEV
ncbi:MAG TPA: hypothetical protein VNN19_06880 [bacterium]|nr:hypothetical protein [bacterium]